MSPHSLLLLGLALAALFSAPSRAWPAGLRAPQDPPPAAKPEDPFRALTLPAALEAARAEGRIVLAEFSAPWNEDSKRLAELTWSDSRVRAWIEAHAVAVRVNADQEAELVQAHRVRGYPTLLLLEPAGGEVHRIVGFFSAETFLKSAEDRMALFRELVAAREALAAAPKDPAAHLRLARALRRYPLRQQEALEALLAAWELGAGVESFRTVRVGALVSELGTLMRSHAPATTALERLREEVNKRLLAPPAALPEDAHEQERERLRAEAQRRLLQHAEELVALNSVLGQPGSTLAAYDTLRVRADTPPDVLALLLNDAVVGLLVHQKRYEDLLRGLGDVIARVEARLAALQASKGADDPKEARAVTIERNQAVAEAARYYEALLGAGKPERAGDLRELLLVFEPTSHSYLALINASLSAGAPAAARELAERGRKELPELEARRLASLLQRVDLTGK